MTDLTVSFVALERGNESKETKSSSFRHGSPEPRLQGWCGLAASLQSGYRRSMPV
ncbi:MAG: hypothetical protein ACOYMG_08675 [Candidatus Methylumidiphilus sp.]